MRVGDLVSISDFPAVVSLAHVAALKNRLVQEGDSLSPESAQTLAGYLSEYFTTEPENRAACRSILDSLARADGPGGAFMVRGVYGSGKSHLLAVVSLLAEFPQAWPVFLAAHLEFRDIARCFHPERRLVVVQLALDEASPHTQPLEEIVFEAVQRELRRSKYGIEVLLAAPGHIVSVAEQFLLPRYERDLNETSRALAASWAALAESDARAAASIALRLCREQALPLRFWRSRAEAVGLLDDALRDGGCGGLVILIDELGLFLAAKGKQELDADASFLQFLAQHTSRVALWLVVTIQRSLEEIGDADRHTLRQIRDRFEQHSLSIAQSRQVLSRRLVRKKDPEAFARAIAALHAAAAREAAAPFPASALAESYPLNSMALELLEGLADSVLSKTRSLVQFVQETARAGGLLERPHDDLLSPAEIFDFFWPRMRDMPEVRAQRAAFSFLESRLRNFGEDAAVALLLAKGLLLCNLAGVQWTVRQHAAALACSQVGRAPQYGRVQEALERLRRGGAYVEVSRQPGEFSDVYFLDVTTDTSELLRRRLDEILATLTEEDQRVLEFAYGACAERGLPLGAHTMPRAMPFEWLNTRRWAAVQVCDLRTLDEARLRNAAVAIENPASREDAHLFIGTLYDPRGQQQAWGKASGGVSGRFAAGLKAWLPRGASARDLDLLREYAALRILLQDPALKQSKRAREMQRLASDKRAALEQETVALVKRLYAEGQVLSTGQQAVPAPELEQEWEGVLSGLFRPALAAVFPDFPDLAPRRLLSGRHQVNQVINQFLRPDQSAVFPGSSLEAHVRDFLEPLGLAHMESGRWVVSVSGSPLVEAVLALLPEGQPTSFNDLERALAKTLGLVREQVELAFAAMAKAGWLVPCDAFLRALPFEQMGTPLSEQAPFWARAALIPADKHAVAVEFARALFDWELGQLDLPAQQRLWQLASAWASRMRQQIPALRQSLDELRAALGHEKIMWAGAYGLLARAQSFAEKIPEAAPAREGLSALIEALGEFDNGAADPARLRAIEQFIRQHAARLAALCAYLNNDALTPLPGSMVEKMKQRLSEALAQGEGLIAQADQASRLADDFFRAYSNEYHAWHDQAFAPAHFRPYLEARKSGWYRALQSLASAGLDRTGVFTQIQSALSESAAAQCTGERLPRALQQSPVCPDCGLRMGQRAALPDLHEMETRASQAIAGALAWLKQPEVMHSLEAALGCLSDEAAHPVGALLALPDDAPAEQVAAACSGEAAALLRRLIATPAASRSVTRLQDALRGRLSKSEAARAFSQWLDPQQSLKDDDVIEIT
jgi:hypothetical protein